MCSECQPAREPGGGGWRSESLPAAVKSVDRDPGASSREQQRDGRGAGGGGYEGGPRPPLQVAVDSKLAEWRKKRSGPELRKAAAKRLKESGAANADVGSGGATGAGAGGGADGAQAEGDVVCLHRPGEGSFAEATREVLLTPSIIQGVEKLLDGVKTQAELSLPALYTLLSKSVTEKAPGQSRLKVEPEVKRRVLKDFNKIRKNAGLPGISMVHLLKGHMQDSPEAQARKEKSVQKREARKATKAATALSLQTHEEKCDELTGSSGVLDALRVPVCGTADEATAEKSHQAALEVIQDSLLAPKGTRSG